MGSVYSKNTIPQFRKLKYYNNLKFVFCQLHDNEILVIRLKIYRYLIDKDKDILLYYNIYSINDLNSFNYKIKQISKKYNYMVSYYAKLL
jgi:hypothetical protein